MIEHLEAILALTKPLTKDGSDSIAVSYTHLNHYCPLTYPLCFLHPVVTLLRSTGFVKCLLFRLISVGGPGCSSYINSFWRRNKHIRLLYEAEGILSTFVRK